MAMIRARPGESGTLTRFLEDPRVLVALEPEDGDAEEEPDEELLTAGP